MPGHGISNSPFLTTSYGGGGEYNPDAEAYLTAEGIPNDGTIYFVGTAQEITGEEIWTAVNTFVVGLVAQSLWTKGVQMNLAITGTAAGHKLNLFNPADSDAAFRLAFSGSWTHSKTGYLGNGANTSASTFIVPNTNLAEASKTIGFYSRTNNLTDNGCDMGAGTGGTTRDEIYSRYAIDGNSYIALSNAEVSGGNIVSNTSGRFILTRNSGVLKFYRNNIEIYSASITTTGQTSETIQVGALQYNGSVLGYAAKEYLCHFIFSGLNATEVSNIDAGIQTLFTALKKQI